MILYYLCKIIGKAKNKKLSTGSDFTDQIFTGELFGVDLAGALRQNVLQAESMNHCTI